MPNKKLTKFKTKRKKVKDKTTGLAKLASITTKSISSAISNYKKNQEIKKIKEIKLKKLQESSQIIKEKKELRIWEDKLRKEENKITYPNISKSYKILNWKPKISLKKGIINLIQDINKTMSKNPSDRSLKNFF